MRKAYLLAGTRSDRGLFRMHVTLAKKVATLVVGVIVLAVLSSTVALLVSWHVRGVLLDTMNETVSNVRAAEELKSALLEQRGCVSYYLFDGDPKWLLRLQQPEAHFREWLHRTREMTPSPEKSAILGQLEEVYAQYDKMRNEAVALYDRGETASAERLLTGDVSSLNDQAHALCDRFVAANEQVVQAGVADAQRWLGWVSVAVGGFTALTIVLSAALLALLYFGVAIPVRAMVTEARSFLGGDVGEDHLPRDELRAVGIYLQNLVSGMADAQTTLEQSRRQLRDAEKLASVGKLAAGIAHEIRNPLTAIKMWLFSIEREAAPSDALAKKFNVIADEIRRLENIIGHFLEFSRPPAVNLAPERMAAVVDRTLELLEPRMVRDQIRLVRQVPADLPPVLADREQIRQVLINLLNNAADASNPGGCVQLIATPETDAEGRSTVVVRVCDNGAGMRDEVARRIFEPFFSTKDQGVGLGLCIAAHIVARHGGRLILESTGEQGTTFAMHIPAASGDTV